RLSGSRLPGIASLASGLLGPLLADVCVSVCAGVISHGGLSGCRILATSATISGAAVSGSRSRQTSGAANTEFWRLRLHSQVLQSQVAEVARLRVLPISGAAVSGSRSRQTSGAANTEFWRLRLQSQVLQSQVAEVARLRVLPIPNSGDFGYRNEKGADHARIHRPCRP